MPFQNEVVHSCLFEAEAFPCGKIASKMTFRIYPPGDDFTTLEVRRCQDVTSTGGYPRWLCLNRWILEEDVKTFKVYIYIYILLFFSFIAFPCSVQENRRLAGVLYEVPENTRLRLEDGAK